MMPVMKKLITLAILALPGMAIADGREVDCPHTYRKPPPKKPHRPKTPPKEVSRPPCDCVGKEGPPGPQGPPGEDKVVIVHETTTVHDASGTISLALGVMGSAYLPHSDWAWGPALQLRHTDSKGLQLDVAIGLASEADGTVGDESGFLAQVGVTKFRSAKGGLGYGLGLHLTDIDGSSSNGEVDGRYIALDAHLAYQRPVGNLNLRAEVGPAFAYLRDDVEGRQLALGAEGSLFLGGDL
jgi:hypothetical protein